MVDIAALFGIGFLLVCLLMTAALTYLGLGEGEFTGAPAESEDEAGDETASGA